MTTLAPALAALRAGRLDEAEAICARALAADPADADALGVVAMARLRRGDAAGARSAAERAVAARPGDARARFVRAIIYEAAGEAVLAETDYAEACRIAPNHLPSRINLGLLMMRADRFDEAEAQFAAACAADPSSALAHERLGMVHQRQLRPDKAAAAFTRALALAPGEARIEASLGWALVEAGRLDQAITHLEHAAAARPDVADAWIGLGAARLRAGRFDEALAALDHATALAPGHSHALALRAAVLDALGRAAERRALVDLDRLVWSHRPAVPPGFADVATFNDALERHVLVHPTLVRDRAARTTRGGRQTGDLLIGDKGPVAALETAMRTAIDAYSREALPATGPFSAAHRPARVRLRAWATVLDAAGYQDPHLHPSGWLSGVYYVRVPPAVGSAPGDAAGWIEFGRPDPAIGAVIVPDLRLVRPEEGLMLLFPSFMWHRTVPFDDRSHRISIAFDVLPG